MYFKETNANWNEWGRILYKSADIKNMISKKYKNRTLWYIVVKLNT